MQNDLRYLWGAPGRQIEYMGPELGPRMVFERVPAADGMIAYRSLEGGFWKVTASGQVDLSATDLATASRFREIWFGDDRVGLLAENGRFVSIDSWVKKGPVRVTTDAAGDNEKFWFEVPPIGLVPENTGRSSEKLETKIAPKIGPNLSDAVSLSPSTRVSANAERIADAVKGDAATSVTGTRRRHL